MKKLLTIASFIFFCYVHAEAQITLAPGCITGNNTLVYYLFSNNGNVPLGTGDAGTNVYRYAFDPSKTIFFYIYRQNGIWKHTTGSGNVVHTTLQVSNSPDPPCNGWWKNASSGIACFQSISGTTCDNSYQDITSSEFMPQYVRMAAMPTTALTQISPARDGMMVYDLTSQCVRVYANGSWECLALSKNLGKTQIGTTSQRPAPAIGTLYYNTDLQKYEGYTPSGWVVLH